MASALHDGDFSILWYNFGPAETSVSTLNEEAEVSRSSGSKQVRHHQSDVGFVLVDQVMLADSSCMTAMGPSTGATINVAVCL